MCVWSELLQNLKWQVLGKIPEEKFLLQTPGERSGFSGRLFRVITYSLLTPRGLDVFRNRNNPGLEAAGLQLLILGAWSDLCYRVDLDCPLKAPVQKAGPQSAVSVRWWEPLIHHWDFWWGLWDSGLLPTVFTSCPWGEPFCLITHPPTVACCLTMDPKGAGARDHGLKYLRQWAKIHLLSLEHNCLETSVLTAPPLSSRSLTVTSLSSVPSGSQGSHISISTGNGTSQVPP